MLPCREDQVQPAVGNTMVIDSRTDWGKLRHLNFRKPTSSYLKCITCGIWNFPAPSWVDISKDEHDSALNPPPNRKQRNCSNPTRRPDDIRRPFYQVLMWLMMYIGAKLPTLTAIQYVHWSLLNGATVSPSVVGRFSQEGNKIISC